MRLKKVKNAKELVEKSPYVILNYKELKGKYKTVFNNENPIHIEIGTGKGDFIINMALKYPNVNFIGIEKYDSVLVKATKKLENLNLPNLKLINMDALEIAEVFNKEVDVLYLNFSDPWPKNRHENRRLTSSLFLNKYEKLFIDKKTIIQKTDNRKFFEYSLISYVDNGYKIKDVSLDLYKDDCSSNVASEYEIKFSSKGLPIYKVEVCK